MGRVPEKSRSSSQSWQCASVMASRAGSRPVKKTLYLVSSRKTLCQKVKNMKERGWGEVMERRRREEEESIL